MQHTPWPVTEGLCTLEQHRELSMTTQAKHLFATELIDDVIIANAYASEEELQALGALNKEKQTFDIELYDTTTELEKNYRIRRTTFYRGDVSEYMIRSTQSRVKYKKKSLNLIIRVKLSVEIY